jgi:hypothetical protein
LGFSQFIVNFVLINKYWSKTAEDCVFVAALFSVKDPLVLGFIELGPSEKWLRLWFVRIVQNQNWLLLGFLVFWMVPLNIDKFVRIKDWLLLSFVELIPIKSCVSFLRSEWPNSVRDSLAKNEEILKWKILTFKKIKVFLFPCYDSEDYILADHIQIRFFSCNVKIIQL